MLKNNYLTFGNSIMQKYSGMTSRINPLALIFLQNDEEEQQPPVQPVSVINVRNYFYRTNHNMYNQVVNRYVQNYNQIVSLLQSNTLYAGSPNFKMDVHPVQFNHTQVQTEENLEIVVKQITERLLKEYEREEKTKEQTTKVILQQLSQEVPLESLKVLPLKIKEKIYTEINREIQQNVLPVVYKQEEYTMLAKEALTVLQQSVKSVIEQNVTRLPEPAVEQIVTGMTRELTIHLKKELETAAIQQQSRQTVQDALNNHRDVITNILLKQIEPFIAAMSPGISRSVIRQEILRVCQKEESLQLLMETLKHTNVQTHADAQTQTEVETHADAQTQTEVQTHADAQTHTAVQTQGGIAVIHETLRSLVLKIIEHTDTCRVGKERYERQIVSRLTPLPVRPVHLEYDIQNKETEDVKTEQLSIRQQERVLQQKVVQVYKKEQTAESKYYTHFIEKFLKKTKETMVKEVDRRELPAGIIYHQKPKETVHFVNRDIIKLPLEMLPQSGQENKHGVKLHESGMRLQETSDNKVINLINNEIVSKATGKVVHQIENKIENKINNQIENKIEESFADSTEYIQRRVIRKTVPDFTMKQVVYDSENIIQQNVLEPIVTYNTGRLELTLLVHSESESSQVQGANTKQEISQTAGNSATDTSNMAYTSNRNIMPTNSLTYVHVQEQGQPERVIHVPGQKSILRDIMTYVPQNEGSISGTRSDGSVSVQAVYTSDGNGAKSSIRSVTQTLEVAPVSLVHKHEEQTKDTSKEKNPSETQTGTETFQKDIIFTKDIVTKQNIEHVITEQINKKQEIMVAGQASNESAAGQYAVSSGQSIGQSIGTLQGAQAGQIPVTGVERLISERVSEHVDKNIHEISRQVYRTLERQIKKEQERRGL